jgi:hypothetical protein
MNYCSYMGRQGGTASSPAARAFDFENEFQFQLQG